MDTLESEEDRDKKRKLAGVREVKLTRPSEDALVLKNNRRIKRTEEKTTKRWKSFHKKSRIQSEHNCTG